MTINQLRSHTTDEQSTMTDAQLGDALIHEGDRLGLLPTFSGPPADQQTIAFNEGLRLYFQATGL